MENAVIEAFKQSPWALAMLIIFYCSLKYLERKDKIGLEYHASMIKKQREEYTELILTQRTMFDRFQSEHIDARETTRKSLDYNTVALEKNASATNSNNMHLIDLSKAIDRLAHFSNGKSK